MAEFPVKPMGKLVMKKPGSAGTRQAGEAPPKEVALGNVRVGHNGISFCMSSSCDELPPPPTILLDELQFSRELGKGASGSVALYKHKETREKYAVKKINVQGKQQGMQNVAAEIRNVFMAPSPYAVKLLNAFYREHHLFLVMEYMDGGNLEELLEKQQRLPEPSAAYVAWSLVSALAHLHKKHVVVDAKNEKRQIHRDIKPANLMLNRQGLIKVADFGVAGEADSIGLASFVGTATYMSPERIKGERYGTASDIWSVGIVVAQILKGEYPFKATSGGFMALLKEVTSIKKVEISGVSADAQNFVELCLQQKECERATADQLLRHAWILQYNDPQTQLGYREFCDLVKSLTAPSRQGSTVASPGVPPSPITTGPASPAPGSTTSINSPDTVAKKEEGKKQEPETEKK